MAKKKFPKWLVTVTPFSKMVALSMLVIFPVLGFFYGRYYQEIITSSSTFQRNGKNIININVSHVGGQFPYFSAQLKAPKEYFATDDTMVVSYASQGGMAPPRLVLMKNYQIFGSNTFYDQIHERANDCITVWSSNSMGGVGGWTNMVGPYSNGSEGNFNGQLTEKEDLPVGNRTASVYKLKKADGDIFVGYLNIGNPQATSYFFYTCNDNNKSDLISVIKSLKFRGDIHFQ